VRVTTRGSETKSTAAGGQQGFLGADADAAAILLFYPKNTHFKHILAQIPAEKHVFKCLNKLC